ncbi:MAG: protease modulator HflC [Gammaproteobacteria bacterium]|nr:MAG: protease modulator HflC [Gammaproteobacteria bacterium]
MQRIAIVIVILALFFGSQSVFTVNEAQRAVKLKLQEVVKTDYEPGLYFQVPMVNSVIKFDGRIQTLDAKPQRYLTFEKKNVQVDSFVKWRIGDGPDDLRNYYTSVGGDPLRANQRLFQLVDKALRDEIGKRTIQEAVSGERAEIMRIINEIIAKKAIELGIKLVDIRIKRVDLPADISQAVFDRMSAERDRIAKELRARGRAQAERIRAEADREYTVILAKAYSEGQSNRGDGDARAAELYARAYNKDPEFYSFYRSLNAYTEAFKDKDDIIVLEPDSEFFKYYKRSTIK